jgi:hypothetical protein
LADAAYVLEVVIVPVSGPDRLFEFYRDRVGCFFDVGYAPSAAFRVGQLTPTATPGSAYSRSAGTKRPAAERADEGLPTVYTWARRSLPS